MNGQPPTFIEEEALWASGCDCVAGVDEVGRGPLAGPVVAAAVVFRFKRRPAWLDLIRDSKELLPARREFLHKKICRHALCFGIGMVSHEVIDDIGIVAATKQAMSLAINELPQKPDFLLIDAVKLQDVSIAQKSIIRGDTLSLSIAAASIVAKVTRDHIMMDMDRHFPGYGLARNKGYGTPEHIECLQRLGPCMIHRRSFMPVYELIK